MDNPFTLPIDAYQRDLNQYEIYCQDAAKYLQIETGDSFEVCLEFVKNKTRPGGELGIKDPEVIYLEKVSEGNREKRVGTLSGYLKKVHAKRYPLAPTFTAYQHPDVETSILATYVQSQLDNRSKNKKQMSKYLAEGNSLLAGIFKNRQNRNKIKNNSLSGAHGTSSSVLFNQSSHSTLTSTCRSASSNTNANTERFLTGNRHYYDLDVTINNIVSVLTHSNFPAIEAAMAKFQIEYPSADTVIAAIKRCTDLYWPNSPNKFAVIESLVRKLTPLERAAYLFTGDMYHLSKHAPGVIRDLYDHLAKPATVPVEDPLSWIEKLKGDEIALIGIVCNPLLPIIMKNGKPTKDLWHAETKAADTYGLIGATAKQFLDGVQKYADLVKAFWITPNMPASMAYFPFSVRRTVVASDTDSSIFTSQDWTEWYVGQLDWTQDSFAAAAATTYLCSQVTAHILAIMCGNMGVAKQHMRLLEMKNEYAFNVFGLTSMGKHYFAAMNAQEGVVYMKPHWEIKGATLKNSKAPDDIMNRCESLIKEVCETVMWGEKIEIIPILKEIGQIELNIMDSMERGVPDYFATAQIKPAKSYKGENSPYLQYEMWETVFAPTYGHTPPPPYSAIKVSVDLDSPTKMREWLDSLPNQTMAQAMRDWLAKYNKTNLSTLYLPAGLAQSSGIPMELRPLMQVRNLVYGIMTSYYLFLESLGIFIANDNVTRLVSDTWR